MADPMFDFDRWSELARSDPEAFFKARSEEIERFIRAHAPGERTRLREMQMQIDCARAEAGSPTRAMRRLASMMHERLRLLNEQSDALQRTARRLRGVLRELETLR